MFVAFPLETKQLESESDQLLQTRNEVQNFGLVHPLPYDFVTCFIITKGVYLTFSR